MPVYLFHERKALLVGVGSGFKAQILVIGLTQVLKPRFILCSKKVRPVGVALFSGVNYINICVSHLGFKSILVI